MEKTIKLVTGGAGFIGSAITAALVARGDTVRVLDNLSNGSEDAVPAGAEFIRGDLLVPQDVERACADVDMIFHQAAIRSVPRSVDEPRLTNEANVTGTLNLLIAASDARVRRLIYASSSSVYGDTRGALNHEDLATRPQSPYAVSKLAAENYCRVWSDLGRLSTVSLRYFNVFGPGQHFDSKYAAVFPAFISALSQERPPEVHWDGEQSRDFSYIDDVVAANLAAAEADEKADGAVLNIGGGDPKTINEVLREVSASVGRWIDPVFRPMRSGDIRSTRADISKAEQLLAWTPQAEFTEAVRRTVAWFRKRAIKEGSPEGMTST